MPCSKEPFPARLAKILSRAPGIGSPSSFTKPAARSASNFSQVRSKVAVTVLRYSVRSPTVWGGHLVNTNRSTWTTSQQGSQYPELPTGLRRRELHPLQVLIHLLKPKHYGIRNDRSVTLYPRGRETIYIPSSHKSHTVMACLVPGNKDHVLACNDVNGLLQDHLPTFDVSLWQIVADPRRSSLY